MPVLYSNSRIFVTPVYIFNGRKQTLVDTTGILSALRMRGLHDKRHLLAKLRIAGSENYFREMERDVATLWQLRGLRGNDGVIRGAYWILAMCTPGCNHVDPLIATQTP